MPVWVWIAGGLALLILELALIDAQFFLVFIGLAAIATGLAQLAGLALPPAGELALFAVLAVVLSVFFRAKVYRMLRPNIPDMGNGYAGGTAQVTVDLAPGADGPAEHRGSTWTARNVGTTALPAGTHARIERVEGILLLVRGD
jgi:inner membrane protein